MKSEKTSGSIVGPAALSTPTELARAQLSGQNTERSYEMQVVCAKILKIIGLQWPNCAGWHSPERVREWASVAAGELDVTPAGLVQAFRARESTEWPPSIHELIKLAANRPGLSDAEIGGSLDRTVNAIARDDYQQLSPYEYFAYSKVGRHALMHESKRQLVPIWRTAIQEALRIPLAMLTTQMPDRAAVNPAMRLENNPAIPREKVLTYIEQLRQIVGVRASRSNANGECNGSEPQDSILPE